MRCVVKQIAFVVITTVMSCLSPARAEDWPQFRGINASGVSTSNKRLPTEFSLDKNLKWSVKLGDGVGCPIVAGGKVFTTAMTGEKTFSVFAFDAASGKKLWQKDYETGKLPRITPPNSQASSTPASDGASLRVLQHARSAVARRDDRRGTMETLAAVTELLDGLGSRFVADRA